MRFYSIPEFCLFSLYSVFGCLNPNVDQMGMQIEQKRNPHALDALTHTGYLKGSHLSSGSISAYCESDI